MEKYCADCGKELIKNADFCIGCGRKISNSQEVKHNTNKKNNSQKYLVLPIIIVTLTFLLFIIMVMIDITYPEQEKIIESKIGEELLCEDYKVIINSFQYKTGAFSDYQTIPDGEEWIGLIVTVTNTSTEDRTIKYSDFNIINSNGERLRPDSFTYKVWGVDTLGNVSLIPNGTKTGYVAFSNNNTDNSNIVVEFQCNRNSWFESDTQKYTIKLQ